LIFRIKGKEATNKIGEEIQSDDPLPNRHNLTRYVCKQHFELIFKAFLVKEISPEAEAKTAEATEKFKVDPSKVIRKAPIFIYENKSEPEEDLYTEKQVISFLMMLAKLYNDKTVTDKDMLVWLKNRKKR